MPIKRRSVIGLLSLAAPRPVIAQPRGQDFPARPIRLIVPFTPGSITDVAARYYATKVGGIVGQPLVVDNRPGANGLIGVAATLNAPADGYTVLIGTTSTLATNVALYRSLPYDPLRDLAPVGLMTVVPTVIVAHRDSRYRTLQDLVAAAKAELGKLNYASGATSYQLMGELFNERSGAVTTAIPYRGSADALTAVVGRQVDFAVIDMSTALSAIRDGVLRALAVASERRVESLPETPTAMEAGVPDFLASTWAGAMVSARTPAAELARMQAWWTQVTEASETASFFRSIGAEPAAGGPGTLRRLQEESIPLWKRMADRAKIELL